MIPAILGSLAALLILGAVALFVVWTVLGAEREAAELAAELGHPADDLTRIADAVTDHQGRAL